MRRPLEILRNQGLRPGLAAVFVVAFAIACPLLISTASGVLEPQRSTSRRPTQRRRAPQRPRIDYAQFSHTTHVEKQKLACDSCHKFPTKNWKALRTGDAAFADVGEFPEHDACLSCHRQQFFARERPAPVICSNCHIAVTPRDQARWLFPSLGDLTDPKLKRRNAPSEFGVGFPHDKHLDVVGFNGPSHSVPCAVADGQDSTRDGLCSRLLSPGHPLPRTVLNSRRDRSVVFTAVAFRPVAQDEPKSCVVCHQTYQPQGDSNDEYVSKPPSDLGDGFWLKKGTFKTTPVSHTTCFTCHNADSGIPPDSKDCNACHKLLPAGTKPRADFDPKLSTAMKITDFVVLRQWNTRMSSGTFRHEGGAHPGVTCLNCHNVSAMNTLDYATRKVAVKSCGGADGCHVTATLDEGGALNFEIDSKKKDPKFTCTKCHVIFGRDPIPPDHSKALVPEAPAKKPGA